jgi:Dyp-type peroxidase family
MPSTLSLPLDDIQGIILRGYGRHEAACFLLAVVEDPLRAAAWIARLPVASVKTAEAKRDDAEPLINVAFTHHGLAALTPRDDLAGRFPREFVEGMNTAERARTLGDFGESGAEHWKWGAGDLVPDVAVMIYARTEASLPAFRDAYAAQAKEAGLRILTILETRRLPDRKEHFGFRDGIAQPVVAGAGREERSGNTVPAGEVLLGYETAFGTPSHSPLRDNQFDFGRNGSYMVLRTLAQDVRAFWKFCRSAAQTQSAGLTAVHVASKMVGRWPSGASLVRHPDADPGTRHGDEDNFAYRDTDADGMRCPFGAHVRRSNPRDWGVAPDAKAALEVTGRHRLLRRGRAFGPPLTQNLEAAEILAALDGPDDGVERGLHFVSFQASLERQFEFVQQQWCGNPNFAGLHAESDPLIGAHDSKFEGAAAVFTIPGEPVRRRLGGITRFVQVRGGAYFFMPSVAALRSLH